MCPDACAALRGRWVVCGLLEGVGSVSQQLPTPACRRPCSHARALLEPAVQDIVVFGRACALRTQEILKPGTPHKPLPADAGDATIARLDKLR